MSLTPQELAQAKRLKEQGFTTNEIKEVLGATRTGRPSLVMQEIEGREKADEDIQRRQFDLLESGGKVADFLGLGGATSVFGRSIARTEVANEAFGTDVESSREFIADPTRKERLGAVGQVGSQLAGTVVMGPASRAGQVAFGAGLGYLYDVSTDTIENKTLAETVTPGIGTAFGAAAPLVLGAVGSGISAVSRGMQRNVAGEAVEEAAETGANNVKNYFDGPASGVAERVSSFTKRFPRGARHIKEYFDEGAEIAARRKSGNPVVINALDEGLDVRTIDFVDQFDDATKRKAVEMLDLADAPRGAAEPVSIPGQVAGDQFDLVINKRKAIGKEIETLSAQLGDEPVSILPNLRSMRINLDRNGIRPMRDGQIRFTADAAYTDKQKTIIQDLYNIATEFDELSPTQIHKRDQLFSQLQREARVEQLDNIFVQMPGNDGNFHKVNIFKAFRDVFSQKLDEVGGGQFKEVNSSYRFYRNLQDDLEDTIFKTAKSNGIEVDPSEVASNSMRRIFSNAMSQPTYRETYSALDATSRKLGYEGARADTLYDFYLTDMKPLYPETVRPASFEGGIRGAISDIVGKVADIGASTEVDQRAALRLLLDPNGVPATPPAAATGATTQSAKTADDFFEPEVKESLGTRIKNTLTDQTGSARNPLGSGETDLQRLGRLRESSAKINRLNTQALDTIEDYVNLSEGGQAAVNVNADPRAVRESIAVIAEELGIEPTPEAFREILDARLDPAVRQARQLGVTSAAEVE